MEAAECIFLWLRNDSPTGVTFEWRLRGWMRCTCVKEELKRSAEKKPSRYIQRKSHSGHGELPSLLTNTPWDTSQYKGERRATPGSDAGPLARPVWAEPLCTSLHEADPLQRIWTSLNVEPKQSMILYHIKEGPLWGSATSKSYPTGSIVFTPLVSTAHEQIKTALFLGHTKYKVAGNSWHVFV